MTENATRPGPAFRASDAERDAAATELGEHFRAGRLDLTEFDDRLGRALGARTRGDLDELLADLPRQAPEPARPARAGRYAGPALGIALIAAAAAAASIGGAVHGHPYWFGWWLIPVTVFLLRRAWWRRRMPARNTGR